MLLLLWTALLGVVHGYPTGFQEANVAAIALPTSFVFLPTSPDITMLVITQDGYVRVIKNEVLLSTPGIRFSRSGSYVAGSPYICTTSERGLLGITIHPDFAHQPWVYIYYTNTREPTGSCSNVARDVRNRVSRFRWASATNTLDGYSEEVIVDGIQSPGGNHNAGDIDFGKDGNLYIAVGDGGTELENPSHSAGTNTNTRRKDILLGKILRVTPLGEPVTTNPWYANPGSRRCGNYTAPPGTGDCQEAYAWGLRNPFRFALDPNTPGTTVRLFAMDVGQNTREEIDDIQPGKDYGWNIREGNCNQASNTACNTPPPEYTDPVYSYDRSAGCNCIVGGAFVPNDAGWPSSTAGLLFYGDYGCGQLQTLQISPAVVSTIFQSGFGGSSLTSMAFGPTPAYLGIGATQSLYMTTFAGGGFVKRVDYVFGGTNSPPTAVILTNKNSGTSAPLTVQFNASLSRDANFFDTLSYSWDFGTNDPPNNVATGKVVSKTFNSLGMFTVTLSVRDSSNATGVATTTIIVGNAPSPTITQPPLQSTFIVDATVSVSGSATDIEDGAITNGAQLSWRVLLHHINQDNVALEHTHPVLAPTSGASTSFVFPRPEDIKATQLSFVEILFSATDSNGIKTEVSRRIDPVRQVVAVGITPALKELVSRFQFVADGISQSIADGNSHANLTWWKGSTFSLVAPLSIVAADSSGTIWVFSGWSDGGDRSRSVALTSAYSTLTATYTMTSSSSTGGGPAADGHANWPSLLSVAVATLVFFFLACQFRH